jgi:hypothetical protein
MLGDLGCYIFGFSVCYLGFGRVMQRFEMLVWVYQIELWEWLLVVFLLVLEVM